jgi:hypothetical protein
LKLGHLSAGSARGGDIAPSFGGASGVVGRHADRPRPHSTMSTALGHSCHRPHGEDVVSPPFARLIAAWFHVRRSGLAAVVKLGGISRLAAVEPSW